jgi:glycosyltransferase involved in cell wall biosynthesis
MKTKVLMVGPASLGGISSLIRTILPVLEKRIDLRFFPTVQKRPPNEAGKLSIGNITLAFMQYVRFMSSMLSFRPGIIHLHTSQGSGWLKDSFFILISKFFGVHVVVHLHAFDFDKFYAQTPRLMKAYTRWVLHRVDAIICVSDSWKNLIAQIAPVNHIYKYINCININDINDHNEKIATTKVNALFLGAVGNRKGVPELLDALGSLKSQELPLHLWIAGTEEKDGDLALAAEKINKHHLEEKCELIGDVREERKSQLLASADIFVLPSHNEGLPIALLECMASGMAVISTSVGGIPEIIVDGYNGFLVEPGNVDALAEKLAILAKDRELMRKMGRLNREIAENDLNVENYVTKLVQLYQDIN